MKKKYPFALVLFVFAMFLLSFLTAVMLTQYSFVCGMVAMAASAVLLAVVLVFIMHSSSNTMKLVSSMNQHLENATSEYMNSLPSPVAVIDSNNRFVWYNHMFSEKICSDTDLYGLDFEGFVKINLA
ncbi:MAG TPA: RNA/single-stranded DNA exonuclease, partial [Ruminococcus sp.]|nr:RNA/single-stranded DNA exonuclease [Ruminococcus sp.]